MSQQNDNSVLWGVLSGVLATIVASPIALVSAGAGHGDYVLARILFPFAGLIIGLGPVWLPEAIFFATALLQFPAHGAVIGAASGRNNDGWAILGVLAVHALAVGASFTVPVQI